MNKVIEEKLAKWKRPPWHVQSLSGLQRVNDIDLTGTWATDRGGYDNSSMHLKKAGPITYDVVFRTRGCEAAWELKRTALFGGGRLWLNKPIDEYMSLTYDLLYVVRIKNATRLLPADALNSLANQPKMFPYDFFTFAKLPPSK